MDEVDGVGGGDRGGLGALLQIVKTTKVPIICIANDRGNRKITTLLQHSFDIKFTKSSAKDIIKRIAQIYKSEKKHPPND